MDVQEIIDELNAYGFTDTNTADKLKVINNVVWDIDSRETWPFLETVLTLTFDGTNAYPSNWPADHRTTKSLVDTTTGRSLNPERVETVEKTYPTLITEVGQPFIYYFVGTRLNVLRIPAAGSTLRLRYLRKQSELNDASVEADILLPAQHHELIVEGCLARLYLKEDDPELAQQFKASFDERLQTVRQELLQLQIDRPDRIHVVDDADWDY